MIKLNAKQLRSKPVDTSIQSSIKHHPIYIIVENVLDTYNVGAIFRLADAASVSKVFLVGNTATPDDPLVGHKIHKASCGVWKWVEWSYAKRVEDALCEIKNLKFKIKNFDKTKLQVTSYPSTSLRTSKLHVVAIEQHKLSSPYNKFKYQFPLVLIVGHETTGVSKEALKLSDAIVEIPMFGINKSMNVMVSLAIVLWEILKKAKS